MIKNHIKSLLDPSVSQRLIGGIGGIRRLFRRGILFDVDSSKNRYELTTVGSDENGAATRILSRDGRMTKRRYDNSKLRFVI